MINFEKPFMILKRKEDINYRVFTGTISNLNTIDQIKINKEKNSSSQDIFDTVSAIPFANIKEKKGFEANNQDNLKISSLNIEHSKEISYEELIKELPCEKIVLKEKITSLYTQDEYAKIVKDIIDNEIGQGEGANFVIANEKRAKIENFNHKKALSIFKNLLCDEYGSYWSFIFFDGEKFLIGATPEAHIVLKNSRVKMHPISGTFRKKEGKLNLKEFKKDFLHFLNDKKEINELFMVVDEELKMMASFCEKGGMIIGPLLKEMNALIHTEYMLTGKSKMDALSLLKESMYAATVLGSPIKSASKIINKYEPRDRRYYSATIALIGRDENSKQFLDSPILIRTLEISKNGDLSAKVGATLVRNSDPISEAKETQAKINAVFQAITGENKFSNTPALPFLEENDEILEAMQLRNQYLSKFWFFLQESIEIKQLKNKKITIIENDDDFSFMISHMLKRFGLEVNIVSYKEYKLNNSSDLTIVGPGPGDPQNENDPKIKQNKIIINNLLKSNKKFIAVCLGHQILCSILGLKIEIKQNPHQGIPIKIDLFNKEQIVGFYNTYEAKYKKSQNLEISYDKQTLGVYALKDKKKQFNSVQFHPESILTQNGLEILKDMLLDIY